MPSLKSALHVPCTVCKQVKYKGGACASADGCSCVQVLTPMQVATFIVHAYPRSPGPAPPWHAAVGFLQTAWVANYIISFYA